MTDTPETDNLARGNHVVPTEFAQQLERERDDAIEMMKRTRDNSDQIIASQANENILLTKQLDELISQRDGRWGHNRQEFTSPYISNSKQ